MNNKREERKERRKFMKMDVWLCTVPYPGVD